jgi:LppX_LprAFG lipoprotein
VTKRLRTLAVTAATLLLLTLGCSTETGGSDGQAPSTAAPGDAAAEKLLLASADVTKNLTSAHIRVDLKGEFSRVGQASVIEGDAQVRPLVVNGQVTYRTGAVTPLIVAGDTVSVDIGGVWNEVGKTSVVIPPAVIDLSEGLPTIMGSIESPQRAGSEMIDGTESTRITGTMPVNAAKDLLPEATGPADVSVWVRSSGDPLLVRMLIDFSPEQAITVTVSKWDVPVRVTTSPSP